MKEWVRDYQDESVSEAKEILEEFTKHELVKLSKIVNEVRDDLYPRNRTRRRGNIRQWLRKDELRQAFRALPNVGVRCAFAMQLFFCLRVSEIGHCEWQQRSDNAGVLKVYQPKNDRSEFLPVHGETTKLLECYDEFSGYSPRYLNNVWCDMRHRAGEPLDNTVATASDGRDLYQFGTHSLRKTSATLFAQEVGADSVWVKRWLRHSPSSDDSLTYVGYPMGDWRNHLEEVFDGLYDLIPEM